MADAFSNHSSSLDSPATRAVEITPNDDADLTNSIRALYVGAEGNVKVTTVGGDTVTFVGVAAGSILPVRIARVHDTDTTADSLVGLY